MNQCATDWEWLRSAVCKKKTPPLIIKSVVENKTAIKDLVKMLSNKTFKNMWWKQIKAYGLWSAWVWKVFNT